MKNVQVIDGARNCTYSIFAATDREFHRLFPRGQDIAFIDEVTDRLGTAAIEPILTRLWKRPVMKASARGISGTLFYGLPGKKSLWPTRREVDVDPTAVNEYQRKMFARATRRRTRR